jgi:hypothetical protein
MKKSLFFKLILCCIIIFCKSIIISGQVVVFSEDFSGFTSGTHTTPSTSDVSGSLDTKTLTPGWAGSKIYSAGGEIKLGTSELTGWIETPLITFSGYEGELTLKFDICRWPGDATIVQILLNGTQIGNSITPADEYMNVEIPVTPGISSGKIKFEALSKRFFVDNVVIVCQGLTYSGNPLLESDKVAVFPNPVHDLVVILNAGEYEILEIADISGRVYKTLRIRDTGRIELSIVDLPSGNYFFRFSSGNKIRVLSIIKCI